MFKGNKKLNSFKLGDYILFEFGFIFLRIVKFLLDFIYVIILLFVMFGVGFVVGYFVS